MCFYATAGQVEFLVREEGREEIERDAVADELRRAAVDAVDLHQREILVALAWRTDLAQDGVARLEGVHLDLVLGDVDVVGGVEVVIVGGAQETVAVGHDFQHAGSLHDALEFDAGLAGLLVLLILRLALLLRVLLVLRLALLLRVLLLAGLGLRLLTGLLLLFLRLCVRGCGLFGSGFALYARTLLLLGLRLVLLLGILFPVFGLGCLLLRFFRGLFFWTSLIY